MDLGLIATGMGNCPSLDQDCKSSEMEEHLTLRASTGSVERTADQTVSPFSFVEMDAALNSIPTAAAKNIKKKGKKKEKRSTGGHVGSACIVGGKELPEFYIWSEAEPSIAPCRDNSQVKKLLMEYELAQTHQACPSKGGIPRGPKNKQGDLWDEEQYEGAPTDSKQFRAFHKRLQRRPDQCVRYG